VALLRDSENEYIRWQAAESLGKIDSGNSIAIEALVALLRDSKDKFTRWQAAESLGKIGTGNSIAIEALVALLRDSKDKFTRWQAAESLGKIGTGNSIAIEALVALLRDSKDKFTRWQAAESLGKIGTGNSIAIEGLIELLLDTAKDAQTRIQIAEIIGKIATGNLKAIEKLRKLWHIKDTYTRWLISQVLQKIDSSFPDSDRRMEDELLLFLDITRVRATIDRYFVQNNPKKTEFCYQRILACLDKMQAGKDIFTRRSLLNSYLDTYQSIIAFALQRRDFKRVFFYTEIFRNRYVVERLAQQDVPLPETVPSQLSQAIQQAQQRERKALQIYTNGISENLPEQQLDKFAEQWDEAKEAIEKLYTEVAAIEPEFIAKTKVTPLSHSQVQHLLPSDTAIIEFFFAKDKLLTMLMLPGERSPLISDALSLPLPLNSLENLAQAWVKELSSKSKSKKDKDIDTTQQNLESKIDTISDVLNFNKLLNYIPANIQHLIVVPNNYLHLFPIHALWVNKQKNKRLIDCFSVSYFPSLQVWKICQQRQRHKQSLIGIENPTQDKDLIFAKAEIASICQRQHFSQYQILTGENASKQDILNTATNHHYFHFSGHAEYNFANPLDSYLMLSDDDAENLTLNTIFADLQMPQADLVTLSACCTGVVDAFQPTEEHLGLPTGFLLAGAKAVIGSLWKVNSIATAFLFDEFYRQLEITNNKAIALQKAQNWLRRCRADELRNRAVEWDLSKLEPKEKFRLERALKRLQGIPFQNP
jgi:CHAT domain-containing protein